MSSKRVCKPSLPKVYVYTFCGKTSADLHMAESADVGKKLMEINATPPVNAMLTLALTTDSDPLDCFNQDIAYRGNCLRTAERKKQRRIEAARSITSILLSL